MVDEIWALSCWENQLCPYLLFRREAAVFEMIRSGKEHQESKERMVSSGILFIALIFNNWRFPFCAFLRVWFEGFLAVLLCLLFWGL